MATSRRWPAWIAGGLAVGWLASRLAVPRLLEAAYEGRSFGFFNALVTKQATHSLQDYLDQWDRVSWGGLLLVVAAVLPWLLSRRWPRVADAMDRGASGQRPVWPLHVLVAAGCVAFVIVSWYRWPVGFVYLITEDYWAEHLGFLAWFLTAVVATVGMVRQPGLRRPALGLLAVGAFFVAMEEISWGQNLLSFPSPGFFREHNLQGETNVHNLVENQIKYHLLGWVIVGYTLLMPFLTRAIPWTGRILDRLGIPVVPPRLWAYFLAAALFFVSEPVVKSDEIAETLLAVAILALVLDWIVARRESRSRISTGVLIVGTLAYLIGISVLLETLFTRPDAADWRLRDFAVDHYPRKGLPAQGRELLEFVNADPERATVRTLTAEAGLHLDGGDAAAARKLLQRAEAAEAEQPGDWVDLAEAWARLEECGRAQSAVERARAEAPEDPGLPTRAEAALSGCS